MMLLYSNNFEMVAVMLLLGYSEKMSEFSVTLKKNLVIN